MEIGPLGIHQMIRLDSSGNDTSDSGAVGALIILMLLYLDSCNACFSLTLVACHVFVFHPVAFSDLWDCCDILLIISICVHVPMSLWARTFTPDGWLRILKGKVCIKVLDMIYCIT